MTNQKMYNPADIEPKWQARWEADGLYESNIDHDRPKHYALTMLPYPSGELHIGHWYAMTPSDARARFMRMNGYNVLFPMGFDAFGLPAENAAIKNNIHPKEWTYANINRMRTQLHSMGAMFDWRREAISADPEYYRWTQWFFNQLYRSGKAYRKMSPVDWCPHCNTTLAREQVWGEDRHCERCGTQVIKKDLEQWFFRTTSYSDELLDFESIDWPDRVRLLQTNWIGRSEGAAVIFQTEQGDGLEVFTTRPDTLWGATFMVLAPEHPLVSKVTSQEQKSNIEDYVQQAVRQTDIQRESAEKEKTGIFTGGYAINPVNNARIPIWIADYVLMTYGTGAIMAVPAHDERDFEFALKYSLPILPVIDRPDGLTKSFVPDKSVKKGFGSVLQNASIPFEEQMGGFYVSIPKEKIAEYVDIAQEYVRQDAWIDIIGTEWLFVFPGEVVGWDSVESDAVILDRCKALEVGVREYRTIMEMLWSCEFYRDTLNHHEYGVMINSGEFSGTPGETAVQKVTEWLAEQNKGKFEINYRLRDWLISRQRYWGTPIPIVYCDDCGVVTVPDVHLPVLLPDDVEWLPTGESPLKLHPTWKYVECPVCGEPAERETDTMDTFMCSSWYHLRYLSPRYDQGPFDADEYDYWMPVDTYTGGIEHATMHLIYTRFFHKAGRDMGVMKGSEPMVQLRNQGIILGEDSEKMSKSRGNVISPDDLVAQYGTDVVRAYLMFFARWDMGAPWNSKGIGGTARWVRRLWVLITGDLPGPARAAKADPNVLKGLRRKVHQTLRQVTHDFNSFEFNTVISGLMELLNDMYRAMDGGAVGTQEWDEAVDIYLRMAAPVIPHVTEELWEKLGKPYSLHNQPWPVVDEAAAADEQMILVVQVNGKIRDRLPLPVDTTEEQAKEAALNSDAVKIYIDGKALRKVIYVPGRLVNIVV